MSELILIRHGQTALNAQRRFQGHLDAPLDPTGHEQAAHLARHLAGLGLTRPTVHASDLARARQTAEPLAHALGAPLHLAPALRELDFGEWDGLEVERVREEQPELFSRFWSGDPQCRAPGGECTDELAGRALAHLRAHWPGEGETLLLVAHSLTVGALLVALLSLDARRVWRDRSTAHANAAYTRLGLRPQPRVLGRMGEDTHLTGAP